MNILNVIKKSIVPVAPISALKQSVTVYVPLVTSDSAGIATFHDNHFVVINGTVYLRRPWVSPTVDVTETSNGYDMVITDVNGVKNVHLKNGDDYILTEQDKEEISRLMLSNFINVEEAGQ